MGHNVLVSHPPGFSPIPLLQFNSPRMDRCVGGRASCTELHSGCFPSVNPGIRLYGVK